MPKYFMLECYGPEDQERAAIATVHGLEGVNWMLGKPFKNPITTPIRVTLAPEDGVMMPMFNRGILLMSTDLLDCLSAAGVDNLDLYPAQLTHLGTGQHYMNYQAVNIIGLVAAANLGESQHQTHGEALFDVDFDSLKLDEKKTRGLLLFRLAECVSGIVVHESVRKRVEGRGIKYLDWIPPEEWMG